MVLKITTPDGGSKIAGRDDLAMIMLDGMSGQTFTVTIVEE